MLKEKKPRTQKSAKGAANIYVRSDGFYGCRWTATLPDGSSKRISLCAKTEEEIVAKRNAKIEELENAIVIKVNIMENKIYAWSYILKIVDKEYSVYEEKEPEGSKDWFKNLTNLESINFFTSRGFAVEVQGI